MHGPTWKTIVVAISMGTGLCAFGCKSKPEAPPTDEAQAVAKQEADEVGVVTAAQILDGRPRWRDIATSYRADPEAMETIAGAQDVTIDVVLGTWCGDSRREVSRWLGAIDGLEGGPTVRYIAVDRSMSAGEVSLPSPLTNVPTFWVWRDGEALGRVVESAVEPIEVDIADLISGERSGFISSSVEPPASP